MTDADRRHAKRVAVDLLCTLVTASGTKHSAMARNLSGGGVFLECEQPLKRGERVSLSFNLPCAGRLHKVATESEVVHGPARVSMTAYGIGVEFLEFGDGGREAVQSYIDARPDLV